MKRILCTGMAAALCAGAFANDVSPATLMRFSPMPKAPVLDGKIAPGEWDYASSSFGGISPATGLMTFRQNNFRMGYDAGNIYLAVSSEMPLPPQTLSSADQVELQLQAPGAAKPVVIRFDGTGKGTVPDGVQIVNGFAPDTLNSNRGKCWTAEVKVPLAVLGVKKFEDGKVWGVQMARHWSSLPESGYLHQAKKDGELAAFIPDANAPAVSFDGFGHHGYIATGNYKWAVRIENQTGKEVKIKSDSKLIGIEGAPTLDIENPDLVGQSRQWNIGRNISLKPGQNEIFSLYLMAQFPGSPRLFHTQISDAQSGTEYYRRSMFWEVGKSRRTAVYRDTLGLPYLCAGFYPSYGNKLRVAGVFDSKMPCVMAVVTVKDAAGKILWQLNKGDFGRPLRDFEEETVLPGLPLGDYRVIMESTDMKGKRHSHERTFSVRKFPWQNLNIGMERVIVPPFKPLKVDTGKNEVHALQTGYRLNGQLWDAIYAQGENILAGPVEFLLNGKPFTPGKIRLIEKSPDRVVYTAQADGGKVKLELKQEYDYDGFCKVTARVIPDGKAPVESLELRIPLRDEVVKYYNTLYKSGARATGAPVLSVPAGSGELPLTGARRTPGTIMPYFWIGGSYKGLSWMMDHDHDFVLDAKKHVQRLERKNNAVVFTIDIVNKPTVLEKPFELVMGFEPTPVKPQPAGYRAIGEYMYSYVPPKGADFSGMAARSELVNGLYYPVGALPNNDRSYHDYLFSRRNQPTTRAEAKKFADEYLARNREWMRKHMPLADPDVLHGAVRDVRQYGQNHMLLYHNPAFYSHIWPEAEMYKAEWLPWDYPVDDAANEYVATHTKEYIDKMLWEMRNQARMGYDGMNFDCFALGGGFNTVIGAGRRVRDGKVPYIHNGNMLQIAPPGIRSGIRLFSWRELTKRTATMLFVEKKLVYGVPWVELHATDAQCVPVTAFCSTTITMERGSGGGEFQNRMPESYILADIAGTQSGIIPRPIVSTHGAVKGTSSQDEIKTMIAVSFGYALMNHCDQGVTRESKAYQKSRDAVFTFGYGRAGNRTLPFYGTEKQPVTCDQPGIRTTQVIRPDGKALIMVGNMGEACTAKFDLSGLKYGTCKVTDLFSGKVLPGPEIKIDRHGYALLQIEKQPSK